MSTTKGTIRLWLERGKKENATHMIVVCDTYDYDDYPVYVKQNQNVREVIAEYDGKNMQKIMEVYNYAVDLEKQVNGGLVYNL